MLQQLSRIDQRSILLASKLRKWKAGTFLQTNYFKQNIVSSEGCIQKGVFGGGWFLLFMLHSQSMFSVVIIKLCNWAFLHLLSADSHTRFDVILPNLHLPAELEITAGYWPILWPKKPALGWPDILS